MSKPTLWGGGGGGRQKRQHVYVKSNTLAYTVHGIFAKIVVSNYWGEADTPPPSSKNMELEIISTIPYPL